MNEQIQKLVDQAKQSMPAGLAPEQWLEAYHTKFAELIVRECMLQCHHNDDMDRIEKHFGVEE